MRSQDRLSWNSVFKRFLWRVSFFIFPLLISESAFSSEQIASATLAEASAELSPVLVQIFINQQEIGASTLVFKSDQGQWFIPVETLFAARIRLPADAIPIVENDKTYLPLSLFARAEARFDEALQALYLSFNPSSFEENAVRPTQSLVRHPGTSAAGMFVNYDLLVSTGGLDSQSLFTEWGAALGRGVGLANIAWLRDNERSQIVRLDTSYIVDDPAALATWRFGDALSRPATSLGRPVRFAGIQYATNFSIQPGLVTTPVPTLNGQAALPSIVDLYVNNVLQSSTSIPPGPFSVTTAPIIAGDGEVLVKVRDISGQEQLISGRVYSSPALLAPGLSDFSFEAGALRKNFGLAYGEYESMFGSASYRRGISDTLTLEGGFNAISSGLRVALGSASFAIPGLGTGSIAAGVSSGESATGYQYAAALERRSGRTALSLRIERADERFRQVGVDPAYQTLALDTVFWNYRFDDIGSFGVSYTRQERASGFRAELMGASFSTQRTRFGSFIVSAYQSRVDAKDYSVSLFWILPTDGEWNASLSHTKKSEGEGATIFQAQKTPPYSEGFGWRIQAAINAAQQAAWVGQNRYAMARVEAASYQGQDSARFGLSGSVANIDSQWFATRRIGGSYGLVHLPGLSNVRVYVDNQLVTRTDENGYALLPRLHPYVSNHVSLEQLDLPLDTKIDALVTRPVPGWRSGALVNFQVRKTAAATLRIVDGKGREIPPGAAVTVNGSSETFAVGNEGLAYIEDVAPENQLTVRWSDQQCELTFHYTPSESMVPYLGEFECREALK